MSGFRRGPTDPLARRAVDPDGSVPQSWIPTHIRSDNGLEFIAQQLRSWLTRMGTGPLYIEPGSPWENGYGESFNGTMRD